MTTEKQKTRWQKTRKFFNDLHLWMGLGSGLVVIVICFTGTAYVFNTELREMSAPELYRIAPATGGLSSDEIVQRVEKSTGGKVTSVKIPSASDRAWQVSVRKNEGEGENEKHTAKESNPKNNKSAREDQRKKGGREAAPARPEGRPNRGTVYAVNPYTGVILGDISNLKNGTTQFMRDMFSLHRWLLLDRIEEPIFGELPNRKLGSYISGTATIIFTLGLLTGLVIWFPQKVKAWRQGLVIKWRSGWKRINHDVHNTLAFYSFIFLLIMGLTGPQWSFEWYRTGLRKTLGTYQSPDAPRPEQPKSILPADSAALVMPSLSVFINEASQSLSYEGDYTINLPGDPTSPVVVTKNKAGFFAPAAGDKVFLDQYTASVISTDIFSAKPLGERISNSIKALHVGDVYGTFSKVLYFLACLVATTLPVTGTLIWINKLRKKKKKKKKAESKAKQKPDTIAEIAPRVA